MMRLPGALLLLTAPLAAQSAEELFHSKILPVLERDCQGCHGGAQTLSKLDVRRREGLLQGGMRGPAIVPGKSGESLLLRVLRGGDNLQMPPGDAGKRLPDETIAAFRVWIDAGAPWPGTAAQRNWGYQDEDLWAFRPLRPLDRSKTIDDFVGARLAERGIKPVSKADRRTLIRRATIDLTGLPPTPEEVDAFLRDRGANAFEKLVDRLLASPRYGERWGRHWLDVVRYADSNGYSNDFERPNAWRYRDYVIRSYNRDKPYDRFIREQIAGDELDAGNPEALIATGFLRAGPWEHTGMSVEAVTRQMFLDDVTHATATVFLGLTLGCARCHDHKFDPISTGDYYRMQAIFATTEFARPELPFLAAENTSDVGAGKARLGEMMKRTRARTEEYRTLAVEALLKKHGVARAEDLPKGEIQRAVNAAAGLDPEKYEEYKLFQKHMQLYQESLDRYEPKAFAVSSGPLDGAADSGPNLRPPRRADYKPPQIHILPGGNIQSPAEPVEPGLLPALEKYGKYPAPEVPGGVAGRRSALAKWIAHRDNPLTARVMVNRIWQSHFGRGIAADANNFGKMGRKPTHPELLDWLAAQFIERGWSVKAMHRLIMLSEAYQRGPAPRGGADGAEPELLSYYPPRRLEAEALRDGILAVAGELSLEAGGPGVFPQISEDVARQPQHRMGSLAPAYHPSPLKRERNRRTIYTFQQRSQGDPMIELFNGPSPDFSCERREASTLPTQALTLFNSQFAHDMALALAARVEGQASAGDARIERAFRLVFGRLPDAKEKLLAREHLARQTEFHRRTPPAAKPERKPLVHKITSELTGETFEFVQQEAPAQFEANLHPSDVGPETRAFADLALVLLNSNEFMYVY
jgi:hypothetical protein